MEETKASAQSATQQPSSYRWVMLGVGFVIQMASALSIQGIAPIGTFIRQDLNMSLTQFGYIFSLINLGTVLLLTWVGHKCDQGWVRKCFLVGEIVIGIALAFAALTHAPWQLLLIMFVAGLGNSVAGPCSAKAVVTWFPGKGRAGAMGIKQCSIPFGGMVASAVLPSLALAYGWRIAFALDGLVIAIFGIVAAVLYRESDSMKAMLKASAEKKVAAGPTWKDSKKDLFTRDIIFLVIGGSILLGCQYCMTSYMSLYFSDVFKTNGVENPVVWAGLCLTFTNFAGMLGSLSWGSISDHFCGGRRKGILVGVNIWATLVVLIIAFFSKGASPVGAIIMVVLMGICFNGFSGLWITFTDELAGIKLAGLATGICLTGCFIGMIALPPLFGAVADHVGYFWAYIFIAICAAIGIFSMLLVRENKRKD